MARKACKGENGFAWKKSKELVIALSHFIKLGLVRFHVNFDLRGSKSMTSYELVELVSIIFYCRQISVHLPEFVILAAYWQVNLIE